MPSDLAPATKLPTILIKKPSRSVTPQHSHPDGPRLKTEANSITLQSSSEDKTKVDSVVLQ